MRAVTFAALVVSAHAQGLPTHTLHHDGVTQKPLREGDRWSSYCSHIHCEMEEGFGESEQEYGVRVQHSANEQYGNTHVCKEGLHREGECGCECFDESFGLGFQLTGPAKESAYFRKNFGYDEAVGLGLPMLSESPTSSPTPAPTDQLADARASVAQLKREYNTARFLLMDRIDSAVFIDGTTQTKFEAVDQDTGSSQETQLTEAIARMAGVEPKAVITTSVALSPAPYLWNTHNIVVHRLAVSFAIAVQVTEVGFAHDVILHARLNDVMSQMNELIDEPKKLLVPGLDVEKVEKLVVEKPDNSPEALTRVVNTRQELKEAGEKLTQIERGVH